MFAAIKWNSRYNAREWVTMAGALVVQLSAMNANRQMGESKPGRPLETIRRHPSLGLNRGGMGPQR